MINLRHTAPQTVAPLLQTAYLHQLQHKMHILEEYKSSLNLSSVAVSCKQVHQQHQQHQQHRFHCALLASPRTECILLQYGRCSSSRHH
jgi:hypothetical protein